jgi:tetratricopeptide (TPR) repeat protein
MWHPITSLSHLLDCQLFGLNPSLHHLTSLLFHIASTLVLFGILKRMTGAIWLSVFVAGVFALHPLNVESVAWVAERKTVVSGLFSMLTIAAYIRYAERPSVGRYLGVVFAYGLCIMTKPVVVTLPFVLLLLDFWPLERFQLARRPKKKDSSWSKSPKVRFQVLSLWRLLAEKVPLFILSAILSAITFIVQRTGGAVLPAERLALSYRVGNALVSYVRYITKMIYPSRLAIFYPHLGTKLPLWQPIVCFIVLTALSAVIILTARRRRWLAVGWLWYLGTLIPVIGLVQAGSQAMANRYTYLPAIGIFTIVAWGATQLFSRWRYRRICLGTSAGLLFAVLLICTRVQVKYWQNNLTLYEHVLAVTENNSIIHNSYGCALFEEGQLDEAVIHLKKARQISPKFSLARSNLGKVFLKQGKVDEAIACFNEVLRARKDLPEVRKDLPEVHYYLGLAKVKQERHDDAITHFSEALQLNPAHINARLYLGYSLLKLGRIQPSVEHYYKILQLKPDHLQALNALAWVSATSNDVKIQESINAVEFAERACELTDYKNFEVLDTLAAAYAATGRFPRAIETAEKAVKLAVSQGRKELAEEIQNRLRLYKAKRPYYEK